MASAPDVSLSALLRCEMTAVHQQFVHVLTLRRWGDTRTAERIYAVDYGEFINAMRLMDLMVAEAAPAALGADGFTPGGDRKGILLAEQAMEERMSEAISAAAGSAGEAAKLVEGAALIREGYGEWLAAELAAEEPADGAVAVQDPGLGDAFALIISLIEQAMAHAFVHWHRGERSGSDWAWATSGAAMMQSTKLIHLSADRGAVPKPGIIPAARIAERPDQAFALDVALADRCGQAAMAAAAQSSDAAIAQLLRESAEDWAALVQWRRGTPHPLVQKYPEAFHSFERTVKMYVRPEASAA